jgi:two-component system response regulator HydG
MAAVDLGQAVSVFVSNPFDNAPGHLAGARELLIGEPLVAAELSRLVATSDIEAAKNLVLAAGHARATLTDEPREVLPTSLLSSAVARRLPRSRGAYLRIAMAAGRCYRTLAEIRGSSALMQRARHEAWSACFGDSLRHALELERVIRDHDVLILGETGTGKEKFAQALQAGTPGDESGRAAPAAAINAAAIPDTLVESELFGHVVGAFTGASEPRVGRLRSADGGSFFLDEVGDLPSTTQVKLLRVIETNEVFPVGSDTGHAADVRYIAATHKELADMVERREFRRDLYERVAGNVLRIPPLRERPEDIIEIGRHFVDGYLPGAEPPAAIASWLSSSEALGYDWPGNVRELQNVLRNLLLGLAPQLASRHQPEPAPGPRPTIPAAIAGGQASFQDCGDWYIRRVVEAEAGNLSRAARTLGLDRSTVRRRLKG